MQTTWGSRDGADADDRVRMIRLPQYGALEESGRKSETFEFPNEMLEQQQQLPAYETHNTRRTASLIASYHD